MQILKQNYILMCDTECLNDYWSFIFKFHKDTKQFKLNFENETLKNILKYNEKTRVYIFECRCDNDFKIFSSFYYNVLMGKNAIMYYYNSTGYDLPIINVMLNLVKNEETNINTKLRLLSDYIIKYKFNYESFRKAYWKNFFENNKSVDYKKLYAAFNKPVYKWFLDNFKNCLSNKATKINNVECCKILDVQKIAGFSPAQVKSGEGISMSLKQLQLVHMNYNQKFDFNTYTNMSNIVKDNHYDVFIEYSENDVISLETIFDIYVLPIILDRVLMIDVIRDEKLKDITYDRNLIFTNKKPHTELIVKLLALDNGKKETNFNYSEYIKTNIPEFNKLVQIANKDTNFDKNLDNIVTLNGINVKFGIGGIHGAKEKYTNFKRNLYDFDYDSQYPSTILEYSFLFKNVINVDIYKAIYKARLKYKKLKHIDEYNKKQLGLKLILNSTFGLINSNYDLPISDKKLGNFITLKCQSLLLNLMTRNEHLFCPNSNTDGVYFEIDNNNKNQIEKIVKEDFEINGCGYYKLSVDKIDWVIQNDVNNYIAKIKDSDKLKIKGSAFNIGIKQKFNSNSNIDIFIKNAIKLINKQDITIEPILFKGVTIDCNKLYYLTDKNNGVKLVTCLKKPTILSLNDEIIYVTQDINKADLNIYIKFAEIMKDKILSFDTKISSKLYYEHELIEDTKENNTIKRKNINRLKKLFDIKTQDLGYSGYCGDTKKYTFYDNQQIKQLINYTKTQILNSIESTALTVHSKDNLVIVDLDIFDKSINDKKPNIDNKLIGELQNISTYITKNTKSDMFGNCKLIFKNDMNTIFTIKDKYSKYIEILDTAVVWSLENKDRTYYDNNIEAANISDFILNFDILDIKNEDAKKFIETKEKRKAENKDNVFVSSENLIVKALIEILKAENIDIFEINLNQNNNYAISTACPYCSSHNKDHYKRNKGKIDAYININIDNKGNYYLNVHNLSTITCNNNYHLEYYKYLNKKFVGNLPTKEKIEIEYLLNDLRKYCDIKYDENFFTKNVVKIIATGGGKTYQTASKILYNLLHTDKFTLTTTRQNTNVNDIAKEIKKVMSMYLTGTTTRIDDFLNDESAGIERLGLYKLTNLTPLHNVEVKELNGVITNHCYFYPVGHRKDYNNNMISIKNNVKKSIETIIDEYETYMNRGVIQIQANNYYKYNLDLDTNQKVYHESNSCLFACNKKIHDDDLEEHVFEIPYSNNLQELTETEGIYNYKLDKDIGTKDLIQELDTYCYKYGKSKYDLGKRKMIKFNKDMNLYYIKVSKVQQYKLRDEYIDTNNKGSNFLQLLQKNRSIAIVENIIKVGTEYREELENIETWGTELNTINEFMEFGKENFPPELFKSIKNKLSKSTNNDLYYKYILINTKSYLPELKSETYRLTANYVEQHDGLLIDDSLAHLTSKQIKEMDYFILDVNKRSNDSYIVENIPALLDRDWKTLVFLGRQENVCSIVNGKKFEKVNLSQSIIKTTLANDGIEKTVTIDTNQSEDINDDMIKNTTISYMNSVETQGKNYSQQELCIINLHTDINVLGRIKVDKNGDIYIMSLREAQKQAAYQAQNRISRGEHKYKAVIILGELSQSLELIEMQKRHTTIKHNVITYTKLDRKQATMKAFNSALEHFTERRNSFLENNESVEISTDRNVNVMNFYIEQKSKIKKDKDIYPLIKEKFSISEKTFKRIKAKFMKTT